MYEALSSLDPHKSSGPDNISPALLKYCAVPLTEPLHKLFVMSIHSGQLPGQWKLHLIAPVFKAGNKADVKNYHPNIPSVYRIESSRKDCLQEDC